MIILTTPFNPGDADPGKSYTHVRIAYQTHDARGPKPRITVMVVRCYLDSEGAVVDGIQPLAGWPTHEIFDNGRTGSTDYTDIVATPSAAGTTWFKGAGAALYQWLIDEGHYAGSLVWS